MYYPERIQDILISKVAGYYENKMKRQDGAGVMPRFNVLALLKAD